MSTFFFFNAAAATEIYTLSLHDALPIFAAKPSIAPSPPALAPEPPPPITLKPRSEEHTSELQSHSDLVCRLLLEKKKGEDHEDESAGRNGPEEPPGQPAPAQPPPRHPAP